MVEMTIKFESKLSKVGPLKIIKIPLTESEKFSSRSMVMVKGRINDAYFKGTLEPDGKGSHWIEVNPLLNEEIGVDIGESVSLNLEQIDEWIEPELPEDIIDAFTKANVLKQWSAITTRARWEWIRWIGSTKNSETRKKRINTACSKLEKGDKNPCCFNTTLCTVTEVSKSGILLDS